MVSFTYISQAKTKPTNQRFDKTKFNIKNSSYWIFLNIEGKKKKMNVVFIRRIFRKYPGICQSKNIFLLGITGYSVDQFEKSGELKWS